MDFDRAVVSAVRSEWLASRSTNGFVKCAAVLRRIAEAGGWLTDDVEEALLDETKPWCGSRLTDAYDRLVLMVKAGILVEGQGNFGDDDSPPAHPKVVECRLTKRGRQYVDRQ